MQLVARNTDGFVKLEAFFFPIFQELHPLLRATKVFQFHLLEFARAKGEIARVNFVAKGLSDLGDTKRQFFAGNFKHVLELNKNSLRGFRPKIGHARVIFRRAHVGFEHQVERARLR